MKAKSLLSVIATLLLIAILGMLVISGKVIEFGGKAANTAEPKVEQNAIQDATKNEEESSTESAEPTANEVSEEATDTTNVQTEEVGAPKPQELPKTQVVSSPTAEVTADPGADNQATTTALETEGNIAATTSEPAVTDVTTSEVKQEPKSIKINNPISYENINLGLDLKGGVSIVYEADKDKPTQQEMDSAVALLRKRLDNKGYTEAEVSAQGNKRIRVEIPGIGDPNKAVEEIGRTAELMFIGLTDAQLKEIQESAQRSAEQMGENVNVLQKYQIQQFMYIQGIKEKGELVMRGIDVAAATQSIQQDNLGKTQAVIDLSLTSAGARKFAEGTKKFKGNYIAIMLDDEILSIPRVENEIPGGKAVISGMSSLDEAKEKAELINSGALPFKLIDIQRTAIEARLGEDSFKSSVYAGIVGTIIVFIFMILVYRIPGLIADMALLAYIVLVLSTLSLLNVTLTLPGIAGIILSIGMAVDANIIIFTRIREELNMDKSIRAAIESGFNKAMSAIIDGNFTTFIIALVLFWQGTGPIKGFAQTLMIGIVLSMFTAIVVTKLFMRNFVEMGIKSPILYGAKKKYKKVSDFAKH